MDPRSVVLIEMILHIRWMLNIQADARNAPTVVPQGFELDPDKNVTATSAGFRWDPVDTSTEAMQGEFKGYKVRFWKVGQMDTTKHEVFIPHTNRQHRPVGDKVRAEVRNLPSYSEIEADVVAVNNYFSSNGSNIVNLSTPEGVPSAVEYLEALYRGSTHFLLEWGEPKEPNGIITGYKVGYRTIHGLDFGELVVGNPVNRRRVFLGGLMADTLYRVHVWGLTRKGQGEAYYINVRTAETGSAIAQPKIDEVMITDTSLNVTWTPTDIKKKRVGAGYFLEFREIGGNWKRILKEKTVDFWQHVTGFQEASTYEVRVIATAGQPGTRDYHEIQSDVRKVTTTGAALAQPKIDEVMAGDTSVNVTWTLPDIKGQRVGARFFLEYRDIGASNWKRVTEEKRVDFWLQIKGLQTASTYQVRVIATGGQAGTLNYRQRPSEIRTFTTTDVDASGVPPRINRIRRRNVCFTATETFTLECVAEGHPDPVYHWMKDGQRLDLTTFETKGRVSVLSDVGSLTITKAYRVDAGIYQCVAENRYGKSISDNYNVLNSYVDRIPISEPKVMRTQVGFPSVFHCNAPASRLLAKLRWNIKSDDDDGHGDYEYGDYEYDKNEYFKFLELDERVTMDWDGNLYITNTRMSDEFAYSCVANNVCLRSFDVGPETHLQPYGKPEETQVALMWSSPSDVTGLLKRNIKFKCIFSGNPQPTIVWKRFRKGLDKSRMTKSGDTFEFDIHNLRYKDTGTYVCEGSQPLAETVRRTFHLKVQSKPEWVKEPKDITVGTGKDAVFSCAAKGRPKPIIKWYINGNPIESEPANPRRRLKGNKLKFINLTRSDSQVIQCNATNKHGYLWADVFLNVQGTVKPRAPSRPTIVNIMAKVKSVNVKWYRPESNGARATAIYFVEYQKIGEKEWQRVPDDETEHMQKIEDLEAGTFYKVRVVAAASSNGTFIAGNVVAFRTMGMPTIKNITTASTSANVTWDIPHYKESGIHANIFLEYRKIAESRWERTPERGDENFWQLILGLEAASSYEVRVVAAGIEDSDITSDVVVFSIMAPPTQTPVVVELPDELSCVEEPPIAITNRDSVATREDGNVKQSLADTVCSLKEKVKDLEREMRMLYDVIADEREARRRLEDNVHDIMVSRFQ